MKRNMSNTDRIIRVIISAIFALLFFTNTITGNFGMVLLVLAAIFTATSIFGFCPIYAIFGLSTCKPNTQRQ